MGHHHQVAGSSWTLHKYILLFLSINLVVGLIILVLFGLDGAFISLGITASLFLLTLGLGFAGVYKKNAPLYYAYAASALAYLISNILIILFILNIFYPAALTPRPLWVGNSVNDYYIKKDVGEWGLGITDGKATEDDDNSTTLSFSISSLSRMASMSQSTVVSSSSPVLLVSNSVTLPIASSTDSVFESSLISPLAELSAELVDQSPTEQSQALATAEPTNQPPVQRRHHHNNMHNLARRQDAVSSAPLSSSSSSSSPSPVSSTSSTSSAATTSTTSAPASSSASSSTAAPSSSPTSAAVEGDDDVSSPLTRNAVPGLLGVNILFLAFGLTALVFLPIKPPHSTDSGSFHLRTVYPRQADCDSKYGNKSAGGSAAALRSGSTAGMYGGGTSLTGGFGTNGERGGEYHNGRSGIAGAGSGGGGGFKPHDEDDETGLAGKSYNAMRSRDTLYTQNGDDFGAYGYGRSALSGDGRNSSYGMQQQQKETYGASAETPPKRKEPKVRCKTCSEKMLISQTKSHKCQVPTENTSLYGQSLASPVVSQQQQHQQAPPPRSDSGASPARGKKSRVTKKHVPQLEDEVSLEIGDSVDVEDVFEDGWAVGVNVSTGDYGAFPLSCIGSGASQKPRVQSMYSVNSLGHF